MKQSDMIVICYIVLFFGSFVAAFIEQEGFLMEVQNSLDKVFDDHVREWDKNKEVLEEDIVIQCPRSNHLHMQGLP